MSKEPERIEENAEAAPTGQHTAAVEPAVLDSRLRLALQAAGEKKALAISVLDLRAVANFADFFLITSGANARQVQAISDEIEDRLKKHGTRPQRIEGYRAAEWVLLDYGDFIVHVFESKARQFYDLERLWRDAARVPIPPELTGDGESSPGATA